MRVPFDIGSHWLESPAYFGQAITSEAASREVALNAASLARSDLLSQPCEGVKKLRLLPPDVRKG
jgi:hypothetical protein